MNSGTVKRGVTLLYAFSDPTLNHPRRRHSSGNISTLEMLAGLEGFQLDPYGRVSVANCSRSWISTKTLKLGAQKFFFYSFLPPVSVSRCRTPSFCTPLMLWWGRNQHQPATWLCRSPCPGALTACRAGAAPQAAWAAPWGWTWVIHTQTHAGNPSHITRY